MTLRPAGPDDVPFLRGLHADRLSGVLPAGEPLAGALLEQQWRVRLAGRSAAHQDPAEAIIELDGAPVGAVVTARAPDACELVEIEVLTRFRGAGVGTAVLGEVIRRADAAGLPVRALVERTNPRAHALYRRFGFCDLGADGLMFTIERPTGGSGTS